MEKSGRAKLILFGEHAVVWGEPAVAASLPMGARASAQRWNEEFSRLTLLDGMSAKIHTAVDTRQPGAGLNQRPADDGGRSDHQAQRGDATLKKAFHALVGEFERPAPLDIRVTLDVPAGVGLGSSAALAVATARAIGQILDQPERVDAAVSASEQVFHGNPSGLDQWMASADPGLYFYTKLAVDQRENLSEKQQKPTDSPSDNKIWEMRPIQASPLTLAICQAGPAASTAAMVQGVAERRARMPDLVDRLNALIGEVSRTAARALAGSNWARVGELMDINHGALVSLGVSTPQLDHACHIARAAGAAGAKLTGAGGGGCVVALTPGGALPVLKAWKKQGWSCFEVEVKLEHQD